MARGRSPATDPRAPGCRAASGGACGLRRLSPDARAGAWGASGASHSGLVPEILTEERAEQPLEPDSGSADLPAAGALLRLAEGTPFVGRVELLRWLLGRARVATEGGAFVACVSGEPGIGKTRLAAELAIACRREGMGVLYGRAEDRSGPPYAALAGALEVGLAGVERPHLLRRLGDGLEGLATLLPSLRADAGPPPSSTLDPARLRHAILAALTMLAGERGALLVLDDMQWAARAELEVIEALLDEPEDAAVLVLVLHRHSSDMAGLPIRAGHPRLAHHQLPPLSLAEIEALADLSALSGVPASPAQSVWRATGGNPLLATELLEIGDAPRSRGGARVGQLVTERLAVLPAAAEEVLRLAAVAGLEFEPPLVAAASTAGRDAAMTLLEAARGAHLLVGSPADPGRLAFRHGLVRDALLERMSPEARAGLHRRLGVSLEEGSEALGGASHNPAALAGLAYHFAAAAPLGDWRRAIRYALPVARRALEAGVYEDVIALTSRALAALAQAGDPDPDARLEVQVLLGAAQRALGDEHASQTLADAFDAAEDRGDAARMCDAALASSGSGAWSDGMYVDDRQLEHYERALQALDPGEHARRARLLARLASAYAWQRSEPAARPVAEQAEALARQLGDQRTLAAVLATVRLSLAGGGELARRRRLEDELDELAESLGDGALSASTTLWRFAGCVQEGDGRQLEPLLAEAGEQLRGLSVGNLRHSLAYEQASLALLRGRLGEAETLIARAADAGRQHGLDPTVVESIRLTQMMLLRGEQRRLGELREEAAPLFATGGITVWRAALAEIDAARGVLEGVAERIDPVLCEYARDGPTALCPGGAIAYLSETVVRLGEPARARRVRDLILPLSGQGVYLAGFAGPIDFHLALLERLLDEPAAASEHLIAAMAFCRRLGAPRWQARCAALAAAA